MTITRGSFPALSIASDAAGVLVGAAIITVASAKWTYKQFLDYKEELHRAEINEVDKLYRTYLEKIVISDFSEIKGFPPIFKINEQDKNASVDSMHFTDEEIHAIGNSSPRDMDVALLTYRQDISNAILKLKEYYLNRKDRNDVTACVLSYLLYMLEKQCYNFAGYEYDIAYLNAITKFINAYASRNKDTETPDFSHLSAAHAYLVSAKKALEKHKEYLTLKDIIGKLNDLAYGHTCSLIKTFLQFITEQQYWPRIETATHDEMQQGLISREYVRSKSLGIATHDSEIHIPKSLFNNWLQWLLNYHDESINRTSPMSIDDIKSPEEIFTYSKNQLASIQPVFQYCENFVTLRLDPESTHKKPSFVKITDKQKILERTQFYFKIASLIHYFISLQYLCSDLLKSLKMLGEIYVKNPNHYTYIFTVLDTLCMKIKTNSQEIENDIGKIEDENKNIMRLKDQESFPQTTKEKMININTSINTSLQEIRNLRDKAPNDPETYKKEEDHIKQGMLETAHLLGRVLHVESPPPTPLTQSDANDNIPKLDTSKDMPKKHTIKPKKIKNRPTPSVWQRYQRVFIIGGLSALSIATVYAATLSLSPIMLGIGLFCSTAAIAFSAKIYMHKPAHAEITISPPPSTDANLAQILHPAQNQSLPTKQPTEQESSTTTPRPSASDTRTGSRVEDKHVRSKKNSSREHPLRKHSGNHLHA